MRRLACGMLSGSFTSFMCADSTLSQERWVSEQRRRKHLRPLLVLVSKSASLFVILLVFRGGGEAPNLPRRAQIVLEWSHFQRLSKKFSENQGYGWGMRLGGVLAGLPCSHTLLESKFLWILAEKGTVSGPLGVLSRSGGGGSNSKCSRRPTLTVLLVLLKFRLESLRALSPRRWPITSKSAKTWS